MHIDKIEAIISRGDIDEARSFVKSEEDFLPKNDKDWFRLHDCLEKIGLTTQDELMTRRYLKRNPEASLPRIHFALRQKNRGIHSESLEHLRIAIRTPIHAVEFWKIAAELYAHFSQNDNALAAYANALEIAPQSFWVRLEYVGLLCKIGQTGRARGECPLIVKQAGNNISKCLRSVWIFERWGLDDFSRIGFGRALEILCDFKNKKSWHEALNWLALAPSRIHAEKLNEILRRSVNRKATQQQLDQLREEDPSQYWSDRFLTVAKTHLPEDRDLLLATFAYALDQGNADALLTFGRKLSKVDSDLVPVKSIVVSLEEMAVKGKLPSKLWWENLRKLKV